MTLRDLLLADLARQDFFEGCQQEAPSVSRVVLRTFSPRFMPVVLYRLASACSRRNLAPLGMIFSVANFVLFGLEIARQCEIGPGLYFPHTQGTVIGARRIGKNAVIYHNVTFGAREVDIAYTDSARPTIGDDVIVGAGAKVLGGLVVGNAARIGANSVVLADVPAGATVAGVPARIVKIKELE